MKFKQPKSCGFGCFLFVRQQLNNIKLAYIRTTWKLSNGRYWKAGDIKGNLLTDLNLSFAHIDFFGNVQLKNYDYTKEQVSILHRSFPDLRINLSIGGWGAEGFSKAASTVARRSKFVNSALKILKDLDLNGIDIDWEFPVGPDWGQKIKSSPHDRENYIFLLSDIKTALNNEENLSHKKFTLSTAVPSWTWFIEKNDLQSASRICDYINLMCYDYYGGWSSTTGFNASLFDNQNDPVNWSSSKCVKQFISNNIPAEKMVFGLPTYGFAWSGVSDNGEHGLFQKPQAFLGNFDYNQLDKLYGQGFENYFDEDSKQSYRYNSEKKIFVTYPSKYFISEALKFIKDLKLAGFMYWEYGHDIDGELLQIMNEY